MFSVIQELLCVDCVLDLLVQFPQSILILFILIVNKSHEKVKNEVIPLTTVVVSCISQSLIQLIPLCRIAPLLSKNHEKYINGPHCCTV